MYEHPFYTCSYMYPAHVLAIGPMLGKRIERLFEIGSVQMTSVLIDWKQVFFHA